MQGMETLGVNYAMGGSILCKTVNGKNLGWGGGVTINANKKVSEQCRIASPKGYQIRRKDIDKHEKIQRRATKLI